MFVGFLQFFSGELENSLEELNEKNFIYTVCTKRNEFLWLFVLWSSKVLSCTILYREKRSPRLKKSGAIASNVSAIRLAKK